MTGNGGGCPLPSVLSVGPDGRLDPTFGTNGRLTWPTEYDDYVTSGAMSAIGTVFQVGDHLAVPGNRWMSQTTVESGLVEFDPDGTLLHPELRDGFRRLDLGPANPRHVLAANGLASPTRSVPHRATPSTSRASRSTTRTGLQTAEWSSRSSLPRRSAAEKQTVQIGTDQGPALWTLTAECSEPFTEAVDRLREGQSLTIVDDPMNPMNGSSLLLVGDGQEQIGWVPDYLVEHFHELRDRPARIRSSPSSTSTVQRWRRTCGSCVVWSLRGRGVSAVPLDRLPTVRRSE